MKKGSKLLLNSNDNIVTIAQQYGFGSASYFSKIFAKSEGISPSEYRKLLNVSE
ncbi:MAG: AraC family transcriptional regulator [Ruminococcaceae bacterium]|nr:AraC family transcriptional regulator [Oscillospiraceae bacterium]